jgi:molecular chaperone GrpE
MSDTSKPGDQPQPVETPLPQAQPAAAETDPGHAVPDQEPADPAPAASEQPQIGLDQLRAMIEILQIDLEAKAAEIAEKHEQVLRAVAETENVRRRLEKEKLETAKYAISRFAKDVLTVGDNFQRAIAAVPPEAADSEPVLKSLLDGVVLAERDFIGALERHGVKVINPAGEAFNPHHHQAVMEQDNPEVPSGTVLQVFQVGYLIEDRCLRPAMVVVSRGGPKAVKTADPSGPADSNIGEPVESGGGSPKNPVPDPE